MNVHAPNTAGTGQGSGIIPAENYISPEFAKREAELLWGRVWQMACREEEMIVIWRSRFNLMLSRISPITVIRGPS